MPTKVPTEPRGCSSEPRGPCTSSTRDTVVPKMYGVMAVKSGTFLRYFW